MAATVLDCLSDTVLSACQYAPLEVRRALVSIIEQGAAAPAPYEAGQACAARFSHACLSKLYVLCSRGQDAEPKEQSVRCQLEVAQLALPMFLNRYAVVCYCYCYCWCT